MHFQFMFIKAPTGPYADTIWRGCVSVHCYTTPYNPICIQFGEVHLDPCAFDYTKFDDWVMVGLGDFLGLND